MQLQARLILTAITGIGALVLGLLGGWFGPVLSWWWLPLILVLAFFLVVPWSPVVWSQEDLLRDMDAFVKACDEIAEIAPKVKEMAEELEAKGGLSLEEVQQLGATFEETRTPSPEAIQTLRELLFSHHRRMLVVQTLLLGFIGLGGALLSHVFVLWFANR